jgi:ABC-type uncharacterized transport system permease subunit
MASYVDTQPGADRPGLLDALRNIHITRTGVFSVVFLLVGLFILLSARNNYGPEATTTWTFAGELDDLVIWIAPYLTITGFLYVIAGIVGLIPFPAQTNRLRWIKTALLTIAGVLIVPTLLIVTAAGGSINMTTTLSTSFRLATPIVIGALAGLWCERAGVVNVAIEGMMLTGACIGFVMVGFLLPYMNSQTALWGGVAAAVVAGGLMALLHAWLSITFMTDQVVSGTVINILALGLTSFLRREILLSSEAARETLRIVEVPVLSDIPLIGQVLFTGKPIFLFMFVLVIGSHIVLYYTRWGLRTRAVGENPKAADTLGIHVYWNRYINVVVGGMIAGLAGAWFSLETVGQFDDNMTGGLGFIALAAVIFGKWTPFGAAAGAMLFGFAQALNSRFQIAEVPIPPQFIQMTPYIVTMVVLAGLVGRAVAPRASGTPYKKE